MVQMVAPSVPFRLRPRLVHEFSHVFHSDRMQRLKTAANTVQNKYKTSTKLLKTVQKTAPNSSENAHRLPPVHLQ